MIAQRILLTQLAILEPYNANEGMPNYVKSHQQQRT